jgi:hypothetical protein
MEMTMGVYTHVLHGETDTAVGKLPIPKPMEAVKQATGTDDSHVHSYVQTAGSDGISMAPIVTDWKNTPKIAPQPASQANPINSVTLGSKSPQMSHHDPHSAAVKPTATKAPKSCQAGRAAPVVAGWGRTSAI